MEFAAEEEKEIKPFDPKENVSLQKIWDELINQEFER